MNSLKNIIRFGIFCLAVFSIQNLYAQGRHGSPAKHLERMKAELNLTDAQVNEIKEINETYHAKHEALRASGQGREGRRELRDAHMAEVQSVLNEEQKIKMNEIRAQREARHEKRREMREKRWEGVDKEAFRAEMKKYKDENVLPVLLTQRAKLESAISAEDKATIEQLRTKMMAHKSEMKAKRGACKAKGEGCEKGKKGPRGHKGKKGFKNHEDFQQLRTLVEKYKGDIEPLMEEIAPQRKQWKEGMKTIKEKYLGEKMKGELDGKHDHHRKGRGHHKHGHGKHKGGKKVGKFLLLDPNKTVAENALLEEQKTEKLSLKNLKVYPNPSVTSNAVEYTVTSPANVIVELRDKEGNVVKTVENTYREAGEYKLNVDLNGLKNGIYIYTIQTEDGLISKKFMLSK